MDAHAEDYSEPFRPGKTDEFHLCYTCHMMVHCRFRCVAAWDAYRRQLRNGVVFQPFTTRNWPSFSTIFFTPGGWPVMRTRDPVERTVLDDIHDGALNPLRHGPPEATAEEPTKGDRNAARDQAQPRFL